MPQADAARLSVPNSQGYARRAWCKTRCAHGGLIDPSTITRSCWCRRLAPCVHYSSSLSSRSLSVRLSRLGGRHGQNRIKTNYAAQLSSAALELCSNTLQLSHGDVSICNEAERRSIERHSADLGSADKKASTWSQFSAAPLGLRALINVEAPCTPDFGAN